MATVYVIAGAPGIGKSTAGSFFIPEDLAILDPDLMAQRHRQAGYPDYKEMGNWKFQQLLRGELLSGRDFAIELNLGFQEHYDFLNSVRAFNSGNEFQVILFHSDHPDLCVQRARIRHENGLHLVPEETVREMYSNTLPLLRNHMKMFSSVLAVDIKPAEICPVPCAYFTQENGWQTSGTPLPSWLIAEITADSTPA